jgi:hypothetical protein
MTEENSFLGRGWSFPPTFDPNSRQVNMLEGEADIESSLQILLTTSVGERIMQPKFGCNMEDLVFETLDTTLKTEMKNRIEVAILFFEPRIDLNSIDLVPGNETEGITLLILDYTVRNTNTRNNLVFPFYINEGTFR